MNATTASPYTITGDGTTTASRARSRWRRLRGPLAIVLLVLLAGGVAWLPQPTTSDRTLAPDNPGEAGGRALAQILGRQGVQVHAVSTTPAALDAATAGSTLLVVGDQYLDDSDVAALKATNADLVLVGLDWSLPEFLPGVEVGYGTSSTTTRSAQCADPDAVAAGTITAYRSLQVQATADLVACFPTSGDDPQLRLVSSVVRDGTHRVTALADDRLMRNADLADEGNAALALRTLGRHRDLVWFLPSPSSAAPTATVGAGDLVPRWLAIAALQLLVAGALAAFWRGRRLGPVVPELLPVVVPAAETTRGRGRLYQRSRAYPRAAAALRAGSALRLGGRLGLPRSASAPTLVAAVAAAANRDEREISALLYGPPPADDRALTVLAHELDTLERQVHRS